MMRPTDRVIELWCGRASASEPGDLEACCEAAMRDEERTNADRFRRATTRNQHVVGRGMARTLLAGTRVSPQEIEFVFNSYGKPDVLAPAAIKRPFNIAHTEGLVIFTACDIGHIGCDVERLSRTTDVSIARRFFATPEIDYVMGHGHVDDQRMAFLRVWTLKESFIKAIGRGLSIPLADFAFEAIDSDAPRIRMLADGLGSGEGWKFACVSPADGYIASVAVNVANRNRADVDRIAIEVRDFHTHPSFVVSKV